MKKNTVITKDPILKLIKRSLINLPTPTSISFLWNIGFLLRIVLIIQIVTGIIISINYISSTDIAFNSVIHLIRDTQLGWTSRYVHINGASVFFILIYIHLRRGVYYNSPIKTPIVWISGVVIILLSIITAFIGYVLPWGQISYWGATVITSILSSIPYIGNIIIIWLWGDFSVSQPTLNRILSLHFLIPFILVAIVLAHLILLHQTGSSNPIGTQPNLEKIKFFPYFLIKDISPLVLVSIIIRVLISINPELLGDPENFNIARIISTPTHIKPEWYFLFAYAILRCIPSKLGGVTAIISSILVFLTICIKKNKISRKFNPIKKITFWIIVTIFVLLTWLGGKPVNEISTILAQSITMCYFSVILFI